MNGVKKLAVIMAVVSLSAFARADAVSSAQGVLDAISAASETEPSVIEVATGTYSFSAIITISKPITLKSVSGNPADVTFSLSGGDRLLDVAHAQAVVEGITLKGGSGTSASGGIAGRNTYVSAGTVRNCVVTGAKLTTPDNSGTCATPVLLNGESALMTGCVVSNNTITGTSTKASPGISCAGVAVNGGAALENSLIVDNHQPDTMTKQRDAAGVTVLNGVMRQCTVMQNDGPYVGGVNVSANGSVVNCIIYGNRSNHSGFENDDILSSQAGKFSDSIVAPVRPNEVFFDFARGDYRTAPGLSTSGCGYAPWSQGETVIGFVASSEAVISSSDVTFFVACQNVGNNLSYRWDFGDGSALVEGAESTVTHNFAMAARRTVTLTVLSGGTAVGTAARDIRVSPSVLFADDACSAPTEPYDTVENAAKDIATALAFAAEGTEIRVVSGSYALSKPIEVRKRIRIAGATGNPNDVLIRPGKDVRAFFIDHPDAVVSGFAVEGGSYPSTKGIGVEVCVDRRGGTISNCVFRNASQTFGSGAYMDQPLIALTGPNARMTHSVVSNNVSTVNNSGTSYWGVICPGVFLRNEAWLVNSLVAGNRDEGSRTKGTTDAYAAGVYASNGHILNCTVVNNYSKQMTGGVRIAAGDVVNTVIAGNSSGLAADHNNIYPGQGSLYSYCGTDGWPEGDAATVVATTASLFADWDNGDYSITSGSPLKDAGTMVGVVLPAEDLVGLSRVIGGAVDIGAYEFNSAQFSATFSCEQTSYVLPNEIVFHASCSGMTAGDDVKYYWDFDGDGVTDQIISESQSSEVEVSREFTDEYGTRNVSMVASNFTTGASCPCMREGYLYLVPKTMIVDMTSVHPAFPYDSAANAAADVAMALEAAIKGVTIEVRPGTYELSDQISIEKESVVVRGTDRDTVLFHPAAGIRGFLVNADGARLENVTVENGLAEASMSGLAVQVNNLGGTVSNCVIRNCRADCSVALNQQVSSVYANGAKSLVTHCFVTNNAFVVDSSSKTPGAVTPGVILTGGARLENTLVADNRETGDRDSSESAHASGVYAPNGKLVNCTIVNNSGRETGGVRISSGSAVNCAIAGNIATKTANGNIVVGTEDRFSSCCSDDAQAWNGTCFAATAASMFADYEGKDYSIAPGGPLQDRGTLENLTPPEKDLAGNSRLSGESIDIGAYEVDAEAKSLSFATEQPAVIVPAELVLTATAIGFGELEDLTFAWDFGDGSVAVEKKGEASVSHIYSHGGYPSVSLTVTNEKTGETKTVVRSGYLRLVPQVMKVAKDSPAPAFPYDTDDNAATNVFDAIAVAVPGSRISFAPGAYTNATTISLDKDIILSGASGKPDDVVLYQSAKDRIVYLNAEGARIENLTLLGGARTAAQGHGDVCFVDRQGGIVSNCVIRGVSLSGDIAYGVPVDVACLDSAKALMTHCIVTGNVSTCKTGSNSPGALTLGVYVGNGRLENSLIADNVDSGDRKALPGYPVGVYVVGGKAVNCTIVRNSGTDGGGLRVAAEGRAVNCVSAGNVGGTYGNVRTGTDAYCDACQLDGEFAELFKDAAANDWRPVFNGPLYRKGTRKDINVPATDLAGRRRLYGLRIDIGAFSGDASGLQIIVR